MNTRPWLAGFAALALSAAAFSQDKQQDKAPQAKPSAATVDAAIGNGLTWLCRHEDEDGAWRAATVSKHCDAGASCCAEDMSDQYDTGLTGLAILAILGAAPPGAALQIHGSKPEINYSGSDVVAHASAWLLTKQDDQGSFSESRCLYDDCIATMALCEAGRAAKNPGWLAAAKHGLAFVQGAQKSSPTGKGLWGWRYTPRGDSIADTSVTCWALRSFDSAERAGLHVPRDARTAAGDFLAWVCGKDGVVGYVDPAGAGQKVTGHNDSFDYHIGTMTALGIEGRLATGSKPAAAWLKSAVEKVLLKDLPSAKTPLGVDYYYWHQGAQLWSSLTAHGVSGYSAAASSWQDAVLEAVLATQVSSTEKCASGGWVQPDRWAYAGGPVYSTALNVLTLEELPRPR